MPNLGRTAEQAIFKTINCIFIITEIYSVRLQVYVVVTRSLYKKRKKKKYIKAENTVCAEILNANSSDTTFMNISWRGVWFL